MQVLSSVFSLLSLGGVWLPIEWESKKERRFLYQLFSTTIIILVVIILSLHVVLLTVTEFNIKIYTDILFTLLITVSVFGKAINYIIRREKIIKLADMLLHNYCLPRDSEEFRMKKDADEFVRTFSIVFTGLTQGTAICLMMKPVFQESNQRELPCMVWVPYDLHDHFWKTWTYEFVITIFGVLINATTDVLVSGFVLQACLQLDILDHRLCQMLENLKYPSDHPQISKQPFQNLEERTINEAVLHHDYIIKFAKKVSETFDGIIVYQFIASSLVLSLVIYEYTMGNLPWHQKIMAIGYFMCILSELFSYCWFGNEITLKSLQFGDDIFKLDWTVLKNQSKKNLIFMMLRTSRPVVMRYGSLITVNIESFKSILKVTYTVFNVMKESSAN